MCLFLLLLSTTSVYGVQGPATQDQRPQETLPVASSVGAPQGENLPATSSVGPTETVDLDTLPRHTFPCSTGAASLVDVVVSVSRSLLMVKAYAVSPIVATLYHSECIEKWLKENGGKWCSFPVV
ncbi:hypothetical protein TIFTF001_030145 [Ficus carica]|uniref:Uncharacterized protein n=1 Tax=Ficus carica TaxID=3494 RepID=A0AA88J4H4_FICCA|nr:hypothetical protein TIFTF001_030145 [Ficus carica]